MSDKEYGTYKWAVASLRMNLSIMGLWKKPKNRKDSVCKMLPLFIFNLVLILFHLAPKIWGFCRIYEHFELIVTHIMAVVTYTVSIIKIFFLLSKTTEIHSFFTRIEEDWQDYMSDNERAVMIKNWILTKQVHLCGILFGIAVTTTYHGIIPFNFVLRIPTNLTDTIPGRYVSFYSVYPYDTQPTPVYELTLLNEFIASTILCVALVLADILYTAFVLHTCAQLDILCRRLEVIVEQHGEHILKTMSHYVEHHLRIIRFARDIDNAFNGIVLLVFVHFTLGFCSQAFTGMVLLSKEMTKKEQCIQIPFYIFYSCYLLFCPFVYCWAGERLMMKSENICFAAYNCNWMNLPPSTSILFCLVAIRAQRPLAVTAGKFLPITLNTYTKLIKTCCGYISMLRALNH